MSVDSAGASGRSRRRNQLWQMLRYGVSGASAALAHLVVFYLLTKYRIMAPLPASAIGFAAAIAVNYPLQYYWTFRSRSVHGAAFLRYLCVTLGMLLVNLLLLALALRLFDWPAVLSQALVIVAVFLVNFVVNRRFTFRS